MIFAKTLQTKATMKLQLHVHVVGAYFLTGRLAQLVERRTREHVSGHYRRGFGSPAGQLKLLIVFRKLNRSPV